MKKHYVTFELNYVLYVDEDVVRTSGVEVDGSEFYGLDGWVEQ